MKQNNFIIIYDIFDSKRLPKVRKITYSYALEGQKSAREAPLDRSSMKDLLVRLEDIIDDEDKINIIKVSTNPILLGKAQTLEYEQNGVIIL